MSSSTNTIINPKPCNYGCNIRIYWNTLENAYFEVFSGNRHQCPNRQQSNYNKKAISTQITTNKPKYYSTNNYKKSYYSNNQPKPKMPNSLELLQGHIADIKKKYEFLSDIVSEANGKVHGSQSHIVTNSNVVSLIVYYEVPEGQLDAIKHKFSNYVKKVIALK
jgi:hypothetical protein